MFKLVSNFKPTGDQPQAIDKLVNGIKRFLRLCKNQLINKYCLYSDEDDKNIEKFTRFIEDIASEGMYLKYYNHFDGYHRIYKIPELIDLIDNLL